MNLDKTRKTVYVNLKIFQTYLIFKNRLKSIFIEIKLNQMEFSRLAEIEKKH
jgi:hypothetical protein